MHRFVYHAVPRGYFGQVAVAFDGCQPRIGRAAEVAAVGHREAMRFKRGLQAGDAHRFRPH